TADILFILHNQNPQTLVGAGHCWARVRQLGIGNTWRLLTPDRGLSPLRLMDDWQSYGERRAAIKDRLDRDFAPVALDDPKGSAQPHAVAALPFGRVIGFDDAVTN